MASAKKIVCKLLEMILYKYPLVNALTLLMLFAERASAESQPPINSRIVHIQLVGFLGCGLLMSSHIKQKEAALVYCGQLLYFAHNFYTNSRFQYKEWLRLQMSVRQIGCVAAYILFAYILGDKKSAILRRAAEIFTGMFLFAYAYLINNIKEIRSATLSHIIGDDWGRYVLTVIIIACALSFFSGYFLRDMSLCAAVVIAILTLMVDCDFSFWTRKGVHFWNQVRMVGDNFCICTSLFYAFFHIDNRLKLD